jgi:hypothetical protein
MRAVLVISLSFAACTIPDVTFHDETDGGSADGCSTIWYADVDGDGHGDPAAGTTACAQPAMTVDNKDDCDDRNAQRYPGASDRCDAIDNDCNPSTTDACPAGCQAMKRPGFDNHTYLLCSTKTSWQTARVTCTNAGFQSIRIEDGAENTWLRSAATTVFGPAAFHLGANDLGAEGTWRWDLSGDQFWQGGSNGATVAGRYSNWTIGEPNDADNNEDCAEMAGTGMWNDDDCGDRSFACERISQ